ncbi:hypothetical protein TSAR_005929 [Trichomalopsis sarcophagae]|uniref:Uncharacterized protein n=1 Tax=Trichomalopsis sarcophagae TaxID=543379 RepID=A0A232FDL6_9HYME|nr:hypothetical protein TSAR_005929 [Trichomalopsis sarcophagae]
MTTKTLNKLKAMHVKNPITEAFRIKNRPTLPGGYHQKGKKEEKKNIHKGTSVKNDNGTRNPRERPTRPHTLVVKTAEGNSYTDILRKIKADHNLTILGKSVNKIRKTVAGELLFKLRRIKEVKTQELQEAVKAMLVGKAAIKRLQHQEVFEIKTFTF